MRASVVSYFIACLSRIDLCPNANEYFACVVNLNPVLWKRGNIIHNLLSYHHNLWVRDYTYVYICMQTYMFLFVFRLVKIRIALPESVNFVWVTPYTMYNQTNVRWCYSPLQHGYLLEFITCRKYDHTYIGNKDRTLFRNIWGKWYKSLKCSLRTCVTFVSPGYQPPWIMKMRYLTVPQKRNHVNG